MDMPGGQSLEDRIHQLQARKLAGEASSEELDELRGLLLADHDLQMKMELLEKAWLSPNQDLDGISMDEVYYRHLLRFRGDFMAPGPNAGSAGQSKNYFRLSAWAALILLPLIAWLAYLWGSPAPKTLVPAPPAAKLSSISTRNGNRSKIMLPDGSQVWLNSGSRLDYDIASFDRSSREVDLSGEAYFDIVKDPDKPFIVHSGHMQVRVTGTAFNVKAYPGEPNMETSLLRGSVEVTLKEKPDRKYYLHPEEKLVVANGQALLTRGRQPAEPTAAAPWEGVTLGKVSHLKKDRVILETAWKDNKLVFAAERFRDVAVKLERWYDVRIGFDDPALEDLRFTGVFTTESLSEALEALQLAAPFHFTVNGNDIRIR